jgi:hypothetical protein
MQKVDKYMQTVRNFEHIIVQTPDECNIDYASWDMYPNSLACAFAVDSWATCALFKCIIHKYEQFGKTSRLYLPGVARISIIPTVMAYTSVP